MSTFRFAYQKLFKPLAFQLDPETVHDRILSLGKILGKYTPAQLAAEKLFAHADSSLEQTLHGILFKNPIGLAAGFDKNIELTEIMPSVGFGFMEVGSITGQPCSGNHGTRLWRFPKSKSLLVYYGLKNRGCEALAAEIKNKTFKIPVGMSVAKTNSPHTVNDAAGVADYVHAYKTMLPYGSYSTINISCPNAYGGQPFTDAPRLEALLTALDEIETTKPVFVKLSPDLSSEQLIGILDVLLRHRVAGVISSNLTKNRNNEKIIEQHIPEFGGLSGKVVEGLSNQQISTIYQYAGKKLTIIGCGGVFSAADAYEKIKRGASLIQLITGMIYEGPQLIGEINRGLVTLLKKDGFNTIAEAVGSAHVTTPVAKPQSDSI